MWDVTLKTLRGAGSTLSIKLSTMRMCLAYIAAVSHVCLVHAIILILFLDRPRLCLLYLNATWTQSAAECHGSTRLHRWCEIGLSCSAGSNFVPCLYPLLWWSMIKNYMLGRTIDRHASPVRRHGYIDLLEVPMIQSVCP